MKLVNKGLITLGTAVAFSGLLAANPNQAVEASTWEARTVEAISADLQTDGTGNTQYTIVWGDTLNNIAQAIGISTDQLASINEINNVDLIIAGTTLHVSADHETVSVEESSGEVTSYNVETSEPVATEPAPAQPAPAQSAPVQSAPAQSAPAGNTSTSGSEYAAKEWIAQRESNGSYTAVNGQYWGRYQLNPTLVRHGAGPAEQEAAADKYVADRYGSWVNAKAFWERNGWY